MKESILISGGSGMVGKALTKILEKEYELKFLSRNPKNPNEYKWDLDEKLIDPEAIRNVSHIIHLAGANIGEKKWSDKRKKEIIESRVNNAQLIMDQFIRSGQRIKTFVSASGADYYGASHTENIYREENENGNDFLGKVCRLWEKAADDFKESGVAERVVKIRTGMVISPDGGAFQKIIMTLPYRFITVMGSGKQYVAWIDIEDLIHIYKKAIQDENMAGAYNAVAPHHINFNQMIDKIIATYPKKLLKLKAPSFILKSVMGGMSVLILGGSRKSSEKIIGAGYNFIHRTLDSSIKKAVPGDGTAI